MGFARRLPAPARLAAPPRAGDKPQRYISLSTLGCRCSGDGGWCRRPAPEFIPDRSPGHALPTNDQSGKWWDSREGCRHPPGWPPHPWLGTSPSPTFLCSDSRREPAIPDQSPGHAFAPTTLTRLVHMGLNSYDRCACLTGGGAVITLRTVLRFPNLDTGEASRTNHEWPILRKNSTNQAKLLRR